MEANQLNLNGKRWITEKDGVHEQWYSEARNIKIEQLDIFVNRLMTEYSHSQETVVHAMVAGALATISAMNAMPEGGVGQEQMYSILGIFIRRWANIEGPIKLTSWYGLLHPQNENGFRTIPEPVWNEVMAAGRNMLSADDIDQVDPEIRSHIESVVNGKVPFGLEVKRESH